MLTHEQREDIKHAVETMRGGGVILYPTDTIWGLGCDATNPEAVAKIYAIKQREDAKALISLVDSEAKIDFYVPDVPDVAWQLLEVAERPLTIIYDNVRNLAPNLMAEDGSAALRITREEFSRELCQRAPRPTSADSRHRAAFRTSVLSCSRRWTMFAPRAATKKTTVWLLRSSSSRLLRK